MTKKIVAIWAEDENRLIGVNDGLPWRLPKELKHFKETTMGQALLMGRVTFDGMNRRILPGRETLILTRDKSFEADGVRIVHDMDEVFDWFKSRIRPFISLVGLVSIKLFYRIVMLLLKQRFMVFLKVIRISQTLI